MMKMVLLVALIAPGLMAQLGMGIPVPTLPTHAVDREGFLILKQDPEYSAERQFRCFAAVVSNSCTALHPDLEKPGDRKALAWARAALRRAFRDWGGNVTIRFEVVEELGFSGGIWARIVTPRGEAGINTVWIALMASSKQYDERTAAGRAALDQWIRDQFERSIL